MVSLVLSTWFVSNTHKHTLTHNRTRTIDASYVDSRHSMLPHTAQFIRRHSIKIKIQAMQKLFSLLFAHVPPSPSPPTATPVSPQTLPYTLIFLRWDILRDFPLFVSVGECDAIVARKISAKIPRSSYCYAYFLVSSSRFFLFLFYYTMTGAAMPSNTQ